LSSVGRIAEETIPDSSLLDVSAALVGHRWQRRATRLRLVNIFRRGWITIQVALHGQLQARRFRADLYYHSAGASLLLLTTYPLSYRPPWLG
jgi:hypothetical protein